MNKNITNGWQGLFVLLLMTIACGGTAPVKPTTTPQPTTPPLPSPTPHPQLGIEVEFIPPDELGWQAETNFRVDIEEAYLAEGATIEAPALFLKGTDVGVASDIYIVLAPDLDVSVLRDPDASFACGPELAGVGSDGSRVYIRVITLVINNQDDRAISAVCGNN